MAEQSPLGELPGTGFERDRQRWLRLRARTVLQVVGLLLAVWAVLHVLYLARAVIVWAFVALFLAIAINPLVELLQQRWLHRRGLAVAAAGFLVLAAFVAIGALVVPTVAHQTSSLIDAAPRYIDDLTNGRGRLGFLETRYQVVEKVQAFIDEGGADRLLRLSSAFAVGRSILAAIVATITIIVLTVFMLLEGPVWVERLFDLISPEAQPRWRRIGADVYRTVGGYVNGNLVISLVAGVTTTVVLLVLGVPFAVALGLLVALLDLVPLAGIVIRNNARASITLRIRLRGDAAIHLLFIEWP